jgi:RHS repeat-associated protein
LSLNTATVATYRYDAVNRLTKILDSASAAFTFDYDATSKLTQQKAPNNVKASYQYDGLDRLTRMISTKGTTTVADFQYQFNDANNIAQMIDPAGTNSYGYDAVDRLTSATHSSVANESYAYDSVGNRTSSQLSSSYSYQPFNRLANTSTANYSYDANGNLTSKTDSSGTTQFAWDFENRLKQVTKANGNIVTYKYDALGRRIERNANLVSPLPLMTTARFIYDGADVIRDIDGSGVTTADYVNGPGIDNKLRQTTATAALYFVQDHVGSTRVLTNATGNAVADLTYDSFGNSAGNTLTRYTYTGREFDSDTGLYYYRARWYDPQVGRFISEDPIGFDGDDENFYAYVGGDPLNNDDPSGLKPKRKRRRHASEKPAPSQPAPKKDAECCDNERFKNLLPYQIEDRKAQCRAIRTLLERESTQGTGPASWISSVTFGSSPLDALNNRSRGDILVNGRPFDIDWFIDANALSGRFSRILGPAAYAGGKLLWSGKNWFSGEPQTYYLPYQDPGEVEAAAALSRGKRYRDIFDEHWFKEYCPCEK